MGPPLEGGTWGNRVQRAYGHPVPTWGQHSETEGLTNTSPAVSLAWPRARWQPPLPCYSGSQKVNLLWIDYLQKETYALAGVGEFCLKGKLSTWKGGHRGLREPFGKPKSWESDERTNHSSMVFTGKWGLRVMGKIRTKGEVPGHARLPGEEPMTRPSHVLLLSVSMKISLFWQGLHQVSEAMDWGLTSSQTKDLDQRLRKPPIQ